MKPTPAAPAGLDIAFGWDAETKYKALFDSIDEGFCVIQVLRGDAGQAHDYIFLEANPGFERQTGLTGAIGRSMRSFAPAHEAHWFHTYGEVARTGAAVRFEAPADALGRWYDVYAFRVGTPGQDLVAVLFNDITRRKELERAGLARQETEARYRQLFEHMTEEVHFWRLVRGADGRVGTWRLVDANPPALASWGKPLADIRGRTADEIFGDGATQRYLSVV